MFTAFNTENLRPLTKKNVERESEPEPTGIKKPGSGADQKKKGSATMNLWYFDDQECHN